MNHIGMPEILGDFDGYPAKFTVTLGVVGVVAAATTVQPVTIEIGRVIDEEIAHTAEDTAVGDRRDAQLAAPRNRYAGHHHAGDFGAAIPGTHHGDLVTAGH